MGRMLGVGIIVSLLFGAIGGFAVGYVTKPSGPTPQAREFYVFTIAIDVNETQTGVPHDTFLPDHIVVNRGDTVTIHFFNTEDEAEAHTFTMTAPYAVDEVLDMGEDVDITFTASTAGVFPYRCSLHQPTMTGYLVVLG